MEFPLYSVEIKLGVPDELLPDDIKHLEVSIVAKVSLAERTHLLANPVIGPLVTQLESDVDSLRIMFAEGAHTNQYN